MPHITLPLPLSPLSLFKNTPPSIRVNGSNADSPTYDNFQVYLDVNHDTCRAWQYVVNDNGYVWLDVSNEHPLIKEWLVVIHKVWNKFMDRDHWRPHRDLSIVRHNAWVVVMEYLWRYLVFDQLEIIGCATWKVHEGSPPWVLAYLTELNEYAPERHPFIKPLSPQCPINTIIHNGDVYWSYSEPCCK